MTRIKTLIVEDNDNFRRALRDLLQTKFPFMILEEATNGYEVLAKGSFFPTRNHFFGYQAPW